MAELRLEGHLELDIEAGAAMLSGGEIVAERVIHFADEVQGGYMDYTEDYTEDYDIGDLGAYHATIENVSLRIYATDKKCTLDEAIAALVDKMEGSREVEAHLVGYSEFTILGLAVDTFTIGNHDIEKILESYEGKYVHFVMEC